jgi:hypothetical protein
MIEPYAGTLEFFGIRYSMALAIIAIFVLIIIRILKK